MVEQKLISKIPEGWKLIILGEHFKFKNGLNKEKKFFGFGTPIVNYMDVYPHHFRFANDIKGKVSLTNTEKKNFEVRKGDVLFTRTSETVEEIGLSSVIMEDIPDCVFSGFLLRGRPITDSIDLDFRKYCFRSALVRNQIILSSSQTTRALTNGKLLSKVIIPIPIDTIEQKKIAQILDEIDELIDSFESLIQKKKNIKQGAMQELLTGKRRLEGFKGEWETKRLGDVLNYEQPTAYLVQDTNYDDSYPIPVLTAGKSFILGYTDEERGIFQNPPVIIFDDFTTDSKFVEFPFKVKSSAMKILKPKNDQVNLKFVFDMMQIINFSIGDHKRYWLSEYQFLEVKIPKLNEQEAISKILSDMDSEIQQLENQRDKYTNLKQGMMQKLLTGEIRLI